MTQHIKVEPGESLMGIVLMKLERWPEEWGGYVVACRAGNDFGLWFGDKQPRPLDGGWSGVGAVEAWLDRLPSDHAMAIVTRDKWASSSGAKVGKTLLEALLGMPEWQDDCGEFAAWQDSHGMPPGSAVFCDVRPEDPLRETLEKQKGVWHLKERPSDADTAVVTRSQWILAKQAQGIQNFDKVTNANDAWAAEQARKYPAYWREIPEGWRYLDTYRINELFPVDDKSGAVLHARKKLLVCGARTGGKSMEKDLREAASTIECFLNK